MVRRRHGGPSASASPDHEPKATETIPEIVALIAELIELELAYPAGGGVYSRVDRYRECDG